MLKAINLQKDFKNNKNTFKILKDINLDVKEGEFLSTVDNPTSGKVYYENQNISKMNNKQLSKFRRDNIGFIFQDYNLLDSMSVEDNIALPLVIANEKQSIIKSEITRLAKFFGIESHLKKYPYELSGGQKQRVAAARALITSPKIIFADEPTGALDSKSSSELLNCLKEMNEKFNVTVIMVTHDPFSASYSKKVIFIKDGKLNARIDSSGNRKEFYNSIMNLLTSMGGEVNEFV